jgi:hypothetical protein
MALARDADMVVVLPVGVYFPMTDPRYAQQRIGCFYTRAALSKLLGHDQASPEDLRGVFHDHRRAIERLAQALYECPASYV